MSMGWSLAVRCLAMGNLVLRQRLSRELDLVAREAAKRNLVAFFVL